jgi:hypothetical protein
MPEKIRKEEVMHHTTDGKSRSRGDLLFLACLVLAFVFGLSSCAIKPLPSCIDAVNPVEVSAKRLRDDVDFLTKLVPPRSATNEGSLNKAVEYIAQEFGQTGCRLEKQRVQVEDTDYWNIICSFGPVDGERIIVGAHYDVDKDGTPGADDNASGVAGILELARMVNKVELDQKARNEKPALARRLDLIAYTLEEEPYFSGQKDMGSHHHAESLAKSKVPVRLMMSLEMIGYFSGEYATYIAVVGKWEQRSMISRVSGLMAQQDSIDVVPAPVPTWIRGADLSDHRNYWKFGYPAVMVTDTDYLRNPNYHEATDTIDTLNFNSMAGVVRGVYDAMICY